MLQLFRRWHADCYYGRRGSRSSAAVGQMAGLTWVEIDS